MASTPSGARVVVYGAAGCHLCERAREVVEEVCGDAWRYVQIDGDEGLERRYRERIPVVEVDGEDAFTFFVEPDTLRERLAGA